MVNHKNFNQLIKENERLDDLQREGLQIIQNPKWFCFGMDAVLLSAFANVKEDQRCLDLGCGNGIIPLLLYGRYKEAKSFEGLEIQKDVAQMARRSIEGNGLSDKIKIHDGNIKNAIEIFGSAKFDVITSNPPYLTENHGLQNTTNHKAIARHEIECNLDDLIYNATKLLKPGGHFFMVHRPFRLTEIIQTMSKYKLEPKRMRLIYPYVDKEANMVLIEGVRGGNTRLLVQPPLIVYKEENVYTKEVYEMYYN